MFAQLPKDVVQHIGTLIDESPEQWEALKVVFQNSSQAVEAKRREIGQRDVWIEIHENGSDMYIWAIHLYQPSQSSDKNAGMKILTLRTTVAEVFAALKVEPIAYGD